MLAPSMLRFPNYKDFVIHHVFLLLLHLSDDTIRVVGCVRQACCKRRGCVGKTGVKIFRIEANKLGDKVRVATQQSHQNKLPRDWINQSG